jgi:hypothetical protein
MVDNKNEYNEFNGSSHARLCYQGSFERPSHISTDMDKSILGKKLSHMVLEADSFLSLRLYREMDQSGESF